ncbi:hypothetical protein JRQ81_012221 [Phrynocephalus forsythii]|uniref:Uncharacterized protein n=1 Tax=Phrynocephalus forsythii TaxID=171643 RepID=A0A9Q1AQA6_9SAUR|nr:hypothetical protein JRQ81_012221 [Phrynocephalus forsythii]
MFWWSNDIKINLFGSGGVKRVWQQPGEYKDKCVVPTVKHSDGGVMVWSYMSATSTGELQFIKRTMNAKMYCDLLKQSMIPSLWRMDNMSGLTYTHCHLSSMRLAETQSP